MKAFATRIAIVAGIGFVAVGAWAFVAPLSFFDVLATFKPYNRHFVHDLGAFQIGLGVVLLGAAFVPDALLTALTGTAVGSAFHLVSHVLDRNRGGRPGTDIALFAALTLILAAATLARLRERQGAAPSA